MKAKAVVSAGLVSQQFSAEQWLAAAAQELGAEVKPPKGQDGRVHCNMLAVRPAPGAGRGGLLAVGPPPAPPSRTPCLALGLGVASDLGCTLARELGETTTHWDGSKGGCCAPVSLPPREPGPQGPALTFLCPYCGHLFKEWHHLHACHIHLHKGPVACTKCGVPKIDEEQLKKHKQSCKFVCTDCGKQFARETAFINHKSVH